MNIKTKYDVGYIFWVPRSYTKTIKHTIEMYGKEFWTHETLYKASAKQKVIVGIEISVGRNEELKVEYLVKNFEEFDNYLSANYSEDRITDYTQKEAFVIAKSYASAKIEYRH